LQQALQHSRRGATDLGRNEEIANSADA
jgi:hypothetical protein